MALLVNLETTVSEVGRSLAGITTTLKDTVLNHRIAKRNSLIMDLLTSEMHGDKNVKCFNIDGLSDVQIRLVQTLRTADKLKVFEEWLFSKQVLSCRDRAFSQVAGSRSGSLHDVLDKINGFTGFMSNYASGFLSSRVREPKDTDSIKLNAAVKSLYGPEYRAAVMGCAKLIRTSGKRAGDVVNESILLEKQPILLAVVESEDDLLSWWTDGNDIFTLTDLEVRQCSIQEFPCEKGVVKQSYEMTSEIEDSVLEHAALWNLMGLVAQHGEKSVGSAFKIVLKIVGAAMVSGAEESQKIRRFELAIRNDMRTVARMWDALENKGRDTLEVKVELTSKEYKVVVGLDAERAEQLLSNIQHSYALQDALLTGTDDVGEKLWLERRYKACSGSDLLQARHHAALSHMYEPKGNIKRSLNIAIMCMNRKLAIGNSVKGYDKILKEHKSCSYKEGGVSAIYSPYSGAVQLYMHREDVYEMELSVVHPFRLEGRRFLSKTAVLWKLLNQDKVPSRIEELMGVLAKDFLSIFRMDTVMTSWIREDELEVSLSAIAKESQLLAPTTQQANWDTIEVMSHLISLGAQNTGKVSGVECLYNVLSKLYNVDDSRLLMTVDCRVNLSGCEAMKFDDGLFIRLGKKDTFMKIEESRQDEGIYHAVFWRGSKRLMPFTPIRLGKALIGELFIDI